MLLRVPTERTAKHIRLAWTSERDSLLGLASTSNMMRLSSRAIGDVMGRCKRKISSRIWSKSSESHSSPDQAPRAVSAAIGSRSRKKKKKYKERTDIDYSNILAVTTVACRSCRRLPRQFANTWIAGTAAAALSIMFHQQPHFLYT